jgi:hypothetical protein
MKKYIYMLIAIGLGGAISYLGHIRMKNLLDHNRLTTATITEVYDLPGDWHVPRVNKRIDSYRVSYEFMVDGKQFFGSAVITRQDLEHGFPRVFGVGTQVPLIYDYENPDHHKLKCKLHIAEEKANSE